MCEAYIWAWGIQKNVVLLMFLGYSSHTPVFKWFRYMGWVCGWAGGRVVSYSVCLNDTLTAYT